MNSLTVALHCYKHFKYYANILQVNENAIIDLPTGVVTFHMDRNEPRIPAVAVASGAHIYIYKNLRPYFKFTLPTLDILQAEKEIWSQAAANTLEPNQVSNQHLD